MEILANKQKETSAELDKHPALQGLFALAVVMVPDSDPRVAQLAPGNAACDGSHVFIRASECGSRM